MNNNNELDNNQVNGVQISNDNAVTKKPSTVETTNKSTLKAVKSDCLRVVFLGGLCEVGKNMAALEFNNDIIVIDCGLTFPTADMPGVDLVIPDTTYLQERKDRVRAIILTHGHEDHIGALPYVLKELNVPVFGTQLTLALVEGRLQEANIENYQLNVVRTHQVIALGDSFRVEFIKVNHSIADSCALAIATPIGVVFHTGDFKIDYTPVDGEVADLSRIAELGKKGVLLLMSDSTNVERPGHSMSEAVVGRSLNNIFNENSDRRIIVATFSTNIHRLQQLLDLGAKYKRKVAFSGRSMLTVAEVASKVGQLKYDKNMIVDIGDTKDIADGRLLIISTGSQGEPMSALTRMSNDEFAKVTLGVHDTVIISATPIPGNEKSIYNVINNLYKRGCRVIYESLAEVHASGHACQDEQKTMLALVKPKFFLPVHGEYRHLKKHAEIATVMGIPAQNIHIADIGHVIEFTRSTMRQTNSVPSGHLLVDGLGVGDVGNLVLRDRKHLSEDGLFIIVMSVDKRSGELAALDVTSRGFVYLKENDRMFDEAKQVIRDLYNSLDQKDIMDWPTLKKQISKEIKSFLFLKTHRNPMILPMILES